MTQQSYFQGSEAKNLRVLGAGDSYPKGGHSGRSPAAVQSDMPHYFQEDGERPTLGRPGF
jgi:hypothetical protein